MQFSRIQIVFCLLALSACASIDKHNPANASRPGTAPTTELRKTPDTGQSRAATVESENSVYFSSGEAKLSERSLEVLRRHAARLKDNPQQCVTLIGYADPLGSPSYNLALTQERLDSVLETLRSLGVARGQIRRVSTGQAAAGSDCDSEACRQQMRRVELIFER